MKRILILSLLTSIYTASFAFHVQWGRTIVISKPLYEDVYIAGGNVVINAPVYGDVIIAGGTLNLNDTIANDLIVAGGTVTINGYVGDDIRCAGGELKVLKNVGGDLVITGGRIDVANNVMVFGGVMASGGELMLNGTVQEKVKATGGEVSFNGVAAKDFECRSNKLVMNGVVHGPAVLAARTMQVGKDAAFYNNVRYWNKKGSVDFGQSLKQGRASFDSGLKMSGNEWYYLGAASLLGLVWYVGTVFLFIVLIQYLFSKTLKKAGHTVSQSMAKSLLWGFLFFIGMPLAIVLLFVTVIGIPIGLMLVFFYIGIIILATLTAALVIANWYNDRFEANWGFWQIVFSALILFILFKLISFTPLFGWLIMAVIAFISFGSILRNIEWRKPHKVAV